MLRTVVTTNRNVERGDAYCAKYLCSVAGRIELFGRSQCGTRALAGARNFAR
jgi:hypothetical protein